MGACVNYQDFLEAKKIQPIITGFKAESLNPNLFDFQKVIVEWALRRGRSAIFADTGLGKTLMQNEDDVKHICPLQLDVIERALELWSAPDDLVFSPFLGVGSEGYCSVKMGRRFIGSELKPSYFDQAVKNMEDATRYNDDLFA